MCRSQKGMTLIELMIAVGIVAVLGAIAVPLYTEYVETTRLGVLKSNMDSIAFFEEGFKSTEGSYIACVHVPGNQAASTCDNLLGWEPRTGEDNTDYVVTVAGRTFTVVGDNHEDPAQTETYP